MCDANTYWESADNAFPQTFAVDLGASDSLTSVVLKVPPAWGTRTETLSVLGGNDGSTYATLAGSATYTFNPATGDTATIALPAGTMDRFVRLSITANSGWPAAQFSEVQVIGTARPDLALNHPTTASGVTQTFVAANATDGNTGSYWEGAAGFPATLTVDLGSAQAVGSVVLNLPPSTSWATRTQTVAVQGSTDGTAFSTIVGAAVYTFNPATGNVVTISFTSTGARYVRLSISTNSGATSGQISELSVYVP